MSGRYQTSGNGGRSQPEGCETSTDVLTQIAQAETCYRAFLLSGRAAQMLQAAPGLGVTIPLLFIQCEGMAQSATGLAVGGDLDPMMPEAGFDLDGQFTLFSTDHSNAGEFITVNGWVGTTAILALRQGASFRIPAE